MNVVGKVGSLISQGVYSVATPFHPFGGAVDVIVVQQQDGTFRSTPWYVRFGKFQGVLKGAEKMVRINVNGIDANFHMYLDNSGEAYFIKEVGSGEVGETNEVVKESVNLEATQGDNALDGDGQSHDIRRLEHSVSDSVVVEMREERNLFGVNRIERAESDADRRYYEFQDDQSPLEGSVELSEFGSSQYDNLDSEHIGESQNLNSGVILVSVDGQVLAAPISASEQTSENVELDTPRFNLGPGEEADFCEGNEEFSSGETAWADYISTLNASTSSVAYGNSSGVRKDDSAIGYQLEVEEREGEHSCQAQETQTSAQERDLQMPSYSEDTSINKADVSKSCLELEQMAKHEAKDVQNTGSSLEVQSSPEISHEILPLVDRTEDATVDLRNDVQASSTFDSVSPGNNIPPHLEVGNESVEKIVPSSEQMSIDSISLHSVGYDTNWKDEQYGTSAAVDGIGRPESGDEYSKSELIEPPTESSSEETQNELIKPPTESSSEETQNELIKPPTESSSEETQVHSSIRFEISLCGNELRPGMGVKAAAETFAAHRVSAENFITSATSILKNENLIVRYRERYFSWEKAAPAVLGMAVFSLDLSVEPKDAIPVEQDGSEKPRQEDPETPSGTPSGTPSTPTGRRWRLWPIPFRRVKTLEHTESNSSNEEEFVDSESSLQNSQVETTPELPQKQFIRTNVPTTEQIASLNLKEGQNMITFSFSTRVWGTQQVDAHIYLWKWNARIVISDVDGTITKSDVLGQFMPLVGKDWTHTGVSRLFSAIKENGYQLLFLSARAIVQAYLTRSFLLNLKQDGKALPNGPVVISPDGLFPSLIREVVRRAPHEFKIACLEDIKKLFPADYNPFYAGFGNRDTDELSYRKIGIPKGKIFIINPKGEVAISHHPVDVKTYTSLHTLVNDMFPPTSLVEQEDFNSWNYWKVPLPEID